MPGFRSLARFLGQLALGTGLLLSPGLLRQEAAFGQLPQIRLTALHPTGGQRGTTVEITIVGGTDLEDADRLYFSHPGITAAAKTRMVDGKPQPVANQFSVTIAPEVPVGVYDVRVHGRYGLSNPRTFSVGDRKEILETEPNNTPEQATAIEINSVINGRSDGGADVDWFKFPLKGGQRVIASFRSRRIDSRMDGVLELYHGGRRVSHQNVHGRVEPFLDFTAPADGEYQLKVHDLVYGGGAEYFYRLTLHTGPKIDFILPASGLPNTASEFTVYGRNLPGGQPAALKAADGRELEQLKLQIAPIADPATLIPGEQATAGESGVDGVPFTLGSPSGSSNAATIYFASAPTALEQEPNDSAEKAQKIAVPVEVTGQFQSRGDVDVYQFDAKAGAVFWIEVFGERNDSPADPVLVIDQVTKNDKGAETLKRLATLDDNPVNIGANLFNTTTDDPVFRFAAPAEGSYRVTVRDRAFENRGDPSLVYRLSIRHESPDFRLVVLPPFPSTDPNSLLNTWDIGLRKGDNAHLTVMAFRRDGFTGPIEVTTEGLPRGVTASPATITGGDTTAHLVLSASEHAPEWFGAIRIVGRAHVDEPAALAAEKAAIAARTATVGGLAALDKSVSDTAAALKSATDAATAAKTALDKDASNETLKTAKAGADAALAKAAAAAKAAVDARAAADNKVADANAAVAAAREARDLAARELTHEARSGTIVWAGNPAAQQSAQSRMARGITLSVLKETAPYQLVTDLTQVTVNQGSQILIPFKLLKRAGFDNNVNLTFVTPPKNVQVENKPINKGAAEGLYRVFVQNNAAVGTYTLFAQSQSQVSYSRSPEAAAAAAKEKEAADKLAAQAAEAAKQAAAAKAAAEKNAAAAAEAAKKAPDAKAAAEKAAADAAAVAKKAAEEKVKADKAATDAAFAVKVAGEIVARLKEVLEKDATNESLKGVKADADALAARAAEAAKKVADAKTAAEKKVADTAAAAKQAADAIVAAEKAIPEAAAAAAKAAEQKAAAEKQAAEAEQKSKAAAAVKAAADKKAADTAKVAKPQNVNAFFPAAAIVLEIKPAPGTLSVAVPNGGAVKRGATLEVKVTINRANGFSGPVKLTLPLPPGIAGLSAPEVTIPADRNDGTLVVTTTAEATMGALANLVVRASMDFDGPAAIDQPLAITVQQ